MKFKMNLKEIVTIAMPTIFCFSMASINAYDSLNSLWNCSTGILYSKYLQKEIKEMKELSKSEFDISKVFNYQKSIEYLEAQKQYNDALIRTDGEKGISSGFLSFLFYFGTFSIAKVYKTEKNRDFFDSKLKRLKKSLKLRLL